MSKFLIGVTAKEPSDNNTIIEKAVTKDFPDSEGFAALNKGEDSNASDANY